MQAHKTLEMANGAGKALLEITNSISQINERNLMIATAAEGRMAQSTEVWSASATCPARHPKDRIRPLSPLPNCRRWLLA